MKKEYVISKYKNKWSVLALRSNTYHFIGKGKKYCIDKCDTLNMCNQLKDIELLKSVYNESNVLNND